MKFHVSLWLTVGMLTIAAATTGGAQQPAAVAPQITIHTKDGRAVTTTGISRSGPSIMAKVKLAGAGEGEAGYDVANVARIDFPDPGQLKIATDLLAQGRAEEALKVLGPALAYYAPFRDIPGSWWTALATLQLDILSRLDRQPEADAVAAELGRLAVVPPDVQRALKIRQGASLERSGKHAEALAILDPITRDENVPPQALPEAWLSAGAANLALGRNKMALLSYLHVPVYVPERALFMAPALLGSAVAYGRLEDKTHARESLQQLITAYPNSHEAAEAKDRLQKLNGPQAKAAQSS